MSKEVMNVTHKKGKTEMDKHPHFRDVKGIDEIITKIRFRRTVRRLIKLINCK